MGGPSAASPPTPSPADAASAYVPAPVSFVSSDEDEEYRVTSAYAADAKDGRSGDSAPGAWRDSGRDKVFDVSAGRRRPVVFEEDDDLDVPDFLK
jgi:hypothetical protein